MYMNDWIAELEDILRLGDHDILTHAGRISHEVAVSKAESEFEHYHRRSLNEPSSIEKDFEKAISKIKKFLLGNLILLLDGKMDWAHWIAVKRIDRILTNKYRRAYDCFPTVKRQSRIFYKFRSDFIQGFRGRAIPWSSWWCSLLRVPRLGTLLNSEIGIPTN